MFIPGRRIDNARQEAQRLANWNLIPYRIFMDTSGNLRVERLADESPHSWNEVIHPQSLEVIAKDPILKERHGL